MSSGADGGVSFCTFSFLKLHTKLILRFLIIRERFFCMQCQYLILVAYNWVKYNGSYVKAHVLLLIQTKSRFNDARLDLWAEVIGSVVRCESRHTAPYWCLFMDTTCNIAFMIRIWFRICLWFRSASYVLKAYV